MFKSINIEELEKIQDNINIIDIRNIEKYNQNHIKNAINIQSDKLIIEPQKYLEKQKTYYIYCQKGLTSLNVCQILSNQGYNVINIKGGYENYKINGGN